MAEYYTKDQVDGMAAVIGGRIKAATAPATLATAIDGVADRNLLTDAERTKLAGLESSRFKGVFASLGAIPTAGMGDGDYADIDSGTPGTDIRRAVYDVVDGQWVELSGSVGGETAASIKTKYESNPNTNPFTDAEQAKLAGLVEAADISSFTAALDAALA